MNTKEGVGLAIRYFILVLFGLFNLQIFYSIFTPLTVYPVFWLLIVADSSAKLLVGNLIFFKGFYTEIIPACVAGAAYYLLLILNLSTPMKIEKRIKSIVFLILTFLVLNILRIIFFLSLYKSGFEYFNVAHLFTWYFGSTILVVLIWFANVWLFKIKSIPLYNDIKNIFSDMSKPKAKKKK